MVHLTSLNAGCQIKNKDYIPLKSAGISVGIYTFVTSYKRTQHVMIIHK